MKEVKLLPGLKPPEKDYTETIDQIYWDMRDIKQKLVVAKVNFENNNSASKSTFLAL